MKISKREKTLLIFVIFLALGALYYFYFLSPFMKEMKDIAAKTTEKETQLQVLNIQNSQLKILDEQIAELQTQNADILKTIPTGYNQPELLVFLYQLIQQNGQKTSYNFEETVDLVKLDNSKATLHFYTNYEKLKAVLKQLKECRFNNRIITMAVTLEEEKPASTKTDDTASSATPSKTVTTTTKTGNKTVTSTTTTGSKTDTADTTARSGTTSTDTKSDTKKVNSKYPLQVVMVVEFFNLKGELSKETPEWIIDKKGKTDLFS